jgi:hypothetical protein
MEKDKKKEALMRSFFKDNGQKVKGLYEDGCRLYLKMFCIKHGFYCDASSWVGDDVGGVASVADYFVDMATIRADVDLDAPDEAFGQWYDYCLRAHALSLATPNFRSWVRGCPRASSEELARVEQMREEVEKNTENLKSSR